MFPLLPPPCWSLAALQGLPLLNEDTHGKVLVETGKMCAEKWAREFYIARSKNLLENSYTCTRRRARQNILDPVDLERNHGIRSRGPSPMST